MATTTLIALAAWIVAAIGLAIPIGQFFKRNNEDATEKDLAAIPERRIARAAHSKLAEHAS